MAERLATRARRGVLSFPLSTFDDDLELDPDAYRDHVRHQLAAEPAALFPCCGTGEFFSLTEQEYEQLVTIAVTEAAGRVPVVAGIGYGWAQATRFAVAAERAGADAALLLPHYLVSAPRAGLVAQVEQVAARTSLPLIVYQRDQVSYDADALRRIAAVPNVIGLKDGHGDLERMQRLVLAAPDDFLFFNGVPTAEMQAPAFRAIGVAAYSSAVHAFAPAISRDFFTALGTDDRPRVDQLLREFYWPLVQLRDRQPGYAVSLIKAAARLTGQPVGPVRPPLVEPTNEELGRLESLISNGLRLVEEKP